MTPNEIAALIAEAREYCQFIVPESRHADLRWRLADALEQAQAKVRELQSALIDSRNAGETASVRIAELKREVDNLQGAEAPKEPAPTPAAKTCGTCGLLKTACDQHATGGCNDCSAPATPPREDDWADKAADDFLPRARLKELWTRLSAEFRRIDAAAELRGRVMGLRWAASWFMGTTETAESYAKAVLAEADRLEREQNGHTR